MLESQALQTINDKNMGTYIVCVRVGVWCFEQGEYWVLSFSIQSRTKNISD